MKKSKNILICPLDWGLGHATRCVPVIKKLLENNFNVIIAAGSSPLCFLKKEFHDLQFIDFPGYNVKYSRNSMVLKLLVQIPKILAGIVKEHRRLDKIVDKYNIDVVISDNRYGLWNNKVKSIFITHQIMVKCPKWLRFMEPVFYKLNKFFISRYDECWIPDYEGNENLSGELSHKYPVPENTYFIGPLSRFCIREQEMEPVNKIYDVLFILSGPEPQRTIFEEKIFDELKDTKLKVAVVRGVTEVLKTEKISENITLLPFPGTEDLKNCILSSDMIICRSGYSGIMDLACLGKKAVLIPTPGQTEQEYLAEYLYKRGIFYFTLQKDFDLKKALEYSKNYNGINLYYDNKFLDERIKLIL